MTEQRTRLVGQEPYSYQWYLPSEKGDKPQTSIETANLDGAFDEAVGENQAPTDSAIDGGEILEESAQTPASGKTPHKIYRPKHRALGRTTSIGRLSFKGMVRPNILATAGWSAMSGAGVAALFIRAGPFPGTQLAELGAVWAGIAAFLWFGVSKLTK
jgi:hypothetical protein